MMNNQEYEPPNQQPIYNDPREQPWQGAMPEQIYGEKLQPQRRKRRGPRGCIIAVVATLLLLGLLGAGIGFTFTRVGGPSFGPSITESRTFGVSASPKLVIDDPTGQVTIHSGATGSTVSIRATKLTEGFGGNPNNIHLNYSESSDQKTVTITVDNGPSFVGFPVVNLDITVPSTIDLNLTSNTGSINVNGVTGQMSLQSNTGSITAEQDNLTSASTLKTDTGSVTFNGTIAQNSNYVFSTNTGSVNVTLPPASSFHVDAKTDTGSFNSDFPVSPTSKQGLGSEVHGDVGNSPTTTITLTTNTGSINLNQGK